MKRVRKQGNSCTIGYGKGFDHFNEIDNSKEMIRADSKSSITDCIDISILNQNVWCKISFGAKNHTLYRVL